MRLIDEDMLIRKYINTDIKKFSNSDVKIVLENLKQNILKAPSIDIVRCGECAKRKKNKFCLEHMRYERDDNSFCSYGERSE